MLAIFFSKSTMKIHSNIMRIFATLITISIVFQSLPLTAMAATNEPLGVVNIINIEQEGDQVAVGFQPLPEGLTVTARVDSNGQGDFLTIQSALAITKTGVIAISSGRYNEHDLVVPSGVILRGGYNSRTWQPIANGQTILFGLPGKTSIVLSNGSGIQNMYLEQAGTAVRAAEGASNINSVVILQAEQAIAVSTSAYVRVANSNFVNNKLVFNVNQTNRLFVYNSIFQTNDLLLNSNVESSSFIKNSVFFPNKATLKNIQDQDNVVTVAKPMPNAGWQFPDANGGNRVNQSFRFEGIADDQAKTIPGPTLESASSINAIYLYYQINPGDILRIVDRQNFSKVVLETGDQGGTFRGWMPIPETTQISLLLYSNGDQALPLQIGIDATAKIPPSTYETQSSITSQGIFSNRSEADYFYRPTVIANNELLNNTQNEQIASIVKPVILAGKDWLSGSDMSTENMYALTHSKGFISQILTTDGEGSAGQNFEQRAKQGTSDTRVLSLLSDYINFSTVFGLKEDCSLITTCPFKAEGLKEFLPWKHLSVSTNDPIITSHVGLLNQDGWNNGTDPNAYLNLDFGELMPQGSISWTGQFITPPTTQAHIATFTSADESNPHQNAISILQNPDGNLEIISWDQYAIRTVRSTNGIAFNPGRKYQFQLSFHDNSASLRRDDGLILWQNENFHWRGLRFIKVGKSPLDSIATQVAQTFGNVSVWQDHDINRTTFTTSGTVVEQALANNQSSLAGSVTFTVNSFCQDNSLVFSNGGTSLASISGVRQGNRCKLTLNSSLTSSAQATVDLTDINQRQLQFIWQTNPFSGLTTFNLINDKKELLSTLLYFGSKAISESISIGNAKVVLADSSSTIQLQYLQQPEISLQNLIELRPIQRYEILYSTVESNLRQGIATIAVITVDELRKTPAPEKLLASLTPGQRYYFAARAVLDDGSMSPISAIRDWQVQDNKEINSLGASSNNQSTITSTLALGNTHNYQTAYASTGDSITNSSITGDLIQNHLGDPVELAGNSETQAWSLGKDIGISMQEKAKHIYSYPGEYIVSSIRTLIDGTIIKQVGIVAIGGQSHDHPRITAETWATRNNAPNWTNKAQAQKIPAMIGVNEPIYLLGEAVDVSGRTDNAFTWDYQIDWGDGTITEDAEAKRAFNKTRRVAGIAEQLPIQHTYQTPGIYTIVSQVTDEQGNIGIFQNTVLVTMPEIYPNQVQGLAGSTRLVTVSGGVAPYTVTLPDNTTVELTKPGLVPVPILDNSTLVILDHVGNTTTVNVSTSDSETKDIYIPKDHDLLVEPASAKTRDIIDISTTGEDHLVRETRSHIYYFGDSLPSSIGTKLPSLNNVITYTNDGTVTSEPFLNIGTFGAVLSAIDGNGQEQKKFYSLQITEARFTGQSQAGIVTGTVSPHLNKVPDSIEIWKRGSEDIKLASVTPNTSGRFIYFLPKDISESGYLSLRVKDQANQYTALSAPKGYTLKNLPPTLNGLLETGNGSTIFGEAVIPATNVDNPTFFGRTKAEGTSYTLTIASENPTDYPVNLDENGEWIVTSKNKLEEGTHQFTLKNNNGEVRSEYQFLVDRTAPTKPTITTASWSTIQGQTEPYAFVGIKTLGQQSNDYFVQADVSGKFTLSPNTWTSQYFIAVADAAGNVGPISSISEKEWSSATQISLWQKLRPYLLWSMLIALAATSITYARKKHG
jgi:hypothetical protein